MIYVEWALAWSLYTALLGRLAYDHGHERGYDLAWRRHWGQP